MTLLITPDNFMLLYKLYSNNYKTQKKYQKYKSKKVNTTYKYHEYNKDTRCGGIILNQNLDSVIIVLNRESKIKGEYKWGLPKGHINPNEKLNNCASREIEEETGLKFKFSYNHPRVKINDTFYYIQIIDETENKQFKPKDNKEIAEVKWEKINNIKNINTNRGLKKLNLFMNKIKNLCINK